MSLDRSASASAPAVTVALCTFDSGDYLDDTLASILGQTFRDLELLVVDDGSSNGCVEKITRCADPRVRLVRQSHEGLGAARERALRDARGRLVAFIDHDDLWDPDKLDVQVAALAAHADAGLAFCDTRLVGPNGRVSGTVASATPLRDLDLAAGSALRALLEHGCFIDASSVLAPAEVLRRAGGFDRRLTYVEDVDLWLRVAARHALVHVDRVLSTRRIHARQYTSTHADVALSEQASLLRRYWRQATYAASTRQRIADYMSGQHCECARRLWQNGRRATAITAAAGATGWPGGTRAALAYWAKQTPPGRKAVQALSRVRRQRIAPRAGASAPPFALNRIWFDATPLGAAETGYFNLTLELLRSVLRRYGGRVPIHVDVPRAVARRLPEWLGPGAEDLRLHGLGDVNREPARHSWWPSAGRGCVELLIWHAGIASGIRARRLSFPT
jgi:GT2 family glycosyltransferase